jgi:subtilisin family serine protease
MTYSKTPAPTRAPLIAALLLATSLAACGGGESAAPNNPPAPQAPTPAPVPTPTPTPVPTPPPPSPSAVEFSKSGALAAINAQSAYDARLSGAGVLVAVIDSGLDYASPEFAGRIDARSGDMVREVKDGSGNVVSNAGRGTDATRSDVRGHGTAVAGFIAAAKNDAGIQGVAYGATLLALRADATPAAGSAISSAASNFTSVDAINLSFVTAANAGAKVINLSLASTSSLATLDAGVANNTGYAPGRAAIGASDTVVVQGAGNNSAATPSDWVNWITSGPVAGKGIIVGAVDAANGNVIADFSVRAGSGAARDRFLVAPGVGLTGVAPTAFSTDSVDLFSGINGTSYAAPIVSGAAALLRERWPTLTADKIVTILLDTATDLGAAGTDDIYGRGLLNLTRALQAQGAASVQTASGVTLSLGSVSNLTAASLTLPAALGDAGAGLAGRSGFTFLDGYGRDFAFPLAGRLQSSATPLSIAAALEAPRAGSLQANSAGMALASFASPQGSSSQGGLAPQRPAAKLTLSFGKTEIDLATGMSDPQLAPLSAFGFDRAATRVSASHSLAGGALSVMAARSSGKPSYAALGARRGSSMVQERAELVSLGYGHDGRLAGQQARFGVMLLTGREARPQSGNGVLNIGDDSRFEALMISGTTKVAGIALDARYLIGAQRFKATAQPLRLAPVNLTGWSIGASGTLAEMGWQLSVSQPLRGTGALLGFDDRRFDLLPSGHERRIEAGLIRQLGPWQLRANSVQRFDAGHVSGASDQAAWLRINAAW